MAVTHRLFVKVATADAPGRRTTGIDLDICNLAAVSFADEAVL